MATVKVPRDYDAKYSIKDTEIAIKEVKDFFERELSKSLNLTRVSAPLSLKKSTGLNDDLNAIERPVSFDMKELKEDVVLEIVHSLAKWKRHALKRYGIEVGSGLYADMNAIRRDEDLDNIHSIYVDQWDWERVISSKDRTIDFLKSIASKVYNTLKVTQKHIVGKFDKLHSFLPDSLYFITSQELEDMYPDKTPKERETLIAKDKGAVFIMQIGKVLRSGTRHDGRAPDYDDWELNGDIIVWNPILEEGFEISSMGIRVDKDSLISQLKDLDLESRKELPFHKSLLSDELPLTIGGGIGQSRICMLLLEKAHIGEVQASIWDDETISVCEKEKIQLL